MQTADITPTRNPVYMAAAAILIYAVLIGATDNYVRRIAEEIGLWQFHAMRTVMALVLVGLAAVPLGLRLRPRRMGAVLRRSVVHALAMLLYFGCLGFLPVPQVAAGLFTAPVFVLLIQRVVYGEPIGPVRVIAVALGFAGAMMALGPGQEAPLSWATLMPVAAGFLYALGNIATRAWCEGERPEVLTLGFFLALGIFGLMGLAALAIWQPAVPAGSDGFVLRGWVWPSAAVLLLTLVQAAGSLIAVAALIRGYQLAEASRVTIFEYAILPISAGWAWVIRGEVMGPSAWIGFALIASAGLLIALRAR